MPWQKASSTSGQELNVKGDRQRSQEKQIIKIDSHNSFARFSQYMLHLLV